MAAVAQKAFVTAFVEALSRRSAAVFVGAGMSRAAGYVDWKGLLRSVAADLGLSVDKETDLIELAQFHENELGGRDRLNAAIIDELVRNAAPTEAHEILAALPIDVVWTTNYDGLIERAFEAAGKVADVKRAPPDLSNTVKDRDVVVYKMHGDVTQPHEAVLTKDDYERFADKDKRALFAEALQGDLVSRTFVFLGYSFSDPDVAYILARIRSLLGKNRRTHYYVTRRPQEGDFADKTEFAYNEARFKHRVNDLKRYGIQTVPIDDHAHVTLLLREIRRQQRMRTVFFSGAAHEDTDRPLSELHELSRHLGAQLIADGYRVVSGFGFGMGDSFALGAIGALAGESGPAAWDRLTLRPFPKVIPAGIDEKVFQTDYRRAMIRGAGAGIFVAGVKRDPSGGGTIDSPGVLEEFDLLTAQGGYPIPVGATGGTTRKLWERVRADPVTFFGPVDVAAELDRLGDAGSSSDVLLATVARILTKLREPRVPA